VLAHLELSLMVGESPRHSIPRPAHLGYKAAVPGGYGKGKTHC